MDSAVVSAPVPVIGKPWRRGSVRASMSALLGMTLMASAAVVAAGTGAASAAPSDQEWSWSDARWAEGQSLRGGPGSAGTVEIDWQVDADAAPGQEFSLELPEEIVALTSGDTGTTGVVDLLADDTAASTAPLGVVGTWSADKSVFEVELTDGPGSADADADDGVDPLSGTMEFEVTWADGAALHEGAHKLVLAGPGFSGYDQSTLVAAYAAPAQTPAQIPAQTPTSTPGSATQVTPDGTRYRSAAAAAGGEQGDAGTDADSVAAAAAGEQGGENTAKPKPTKPKPTKPKPKPDPADPDGKDPVDKPKPEPVSRDEGGRKKVASVPSGPVGVGISMPSVGL